MSDSLDRWGERAPAPFRSARRAYLDEGPSEEQLLSMLAQVEGGASVAPKRRHVPKLRGLAAAGLGALLLGGVLVGVGQKALPRPVSVPTPKALQQAVPIDAESPTREVPPAVEPSQDQAKAPSSPPAAVARPTKRKAAVAAHVPKVDDPLAELVLLGRARRILKGHPQRAYALTEEHRTTFPDGQFAQERELLAIEALALLARLADAEQRAHAFKLRYERSVHMRRLAAILERPSP